MQIQTTHQPTGGPSGKPILRDPVLVTLDVPLCYFDGQHLNRTNAIICDRAHALLIYRPMNDWAVKYGFGLTHLGTYNPRQARHEDGSLILYHGKPRWSGHAYGAIDWEGVIANDKHLNVLVVEQQAPAKYQEVLSNIRADVMAAKRTLEWVDESHYKHIGLVPKGGW